MKRAYISPIRRRETPGGVLWQTDLQVVRDVGGYRVDAGQTYCGAVDPKTGLRGELALEVIDAPAETHEAFAKVPGGVRVDASTKLDGMLIKTEPTVGDAVVELAKQIEGDGAVANVATTKALIE